MSNSPWRIKEITWVDQLPIFGHKKMGFSSTLRWLHYKIEDHCGEEVEMSLVLNGLDGSINSVLITTKRDSYLFLGNGAEAIFDFVEKELLGSDYRDDRCDIEEEVGLGDNS